MSPCEDLEKKYPGIFECDNWDWRARVPMWTFNKMSINQYMKNGGPGCEWDCVGELNSPPFVMLELDDSSASCVIASLWDDKTDSLFYYRDWTASGTNYVNDGDTYWAGFWFEKREAAEVFQRQNGGIGSWQPDFKERQQAMRTRRDT